MLRCEIDEGPADGGEAILAGGGEIFQDAKVIEGGWFFGDDFPGCGAVIDAAEECGEAADEGGVGIEAETAVAGFHGGGEPNAGDAAAHAIFFGAILVRQRLHCGLPAYGDGEALLGIVNGAEGGADGVLSLSGERHGGGWKIRNSKSEIRKA